MRFLPIILIVLVFLGYMGNLAFNEYIDKTARNSAEQCMKGFETESFLKPNAESFCNCNADFVRQNPFADKKSTVIKEQISVHVRNCMDTHNKQTIMTECGKMNDKIIEGDGAYFVNCSCFYDTLVEPMLVKWVKGDISAEDIKNGGRELALNSLNSCMKMR